MAAGFEDTAVRFNGILTASVKLASGEVMCGVLSVIVAIVVPSFDVSLTHSAAVPELLCVNPPLVWLSIIVATVVPSTIFSPLVVSGNGVETAKEDDGLSEAKYAVAGFDDDSVRFLGSVTVSVKLASGEVVPEIP